MYHCMDVQLYYNGNWCFKNMFKETVSNNIIELTTQLSLSLDLHYWLLNQ